MNYGETSSQGARREEREEREARFRGRVELDADNYRFHRAYEYSRQQANVAPESPIYLATPPSTYMHGSSVSGSGSGSGAGSRRLGHPGPAPQRRVEEPMATVGQPLEEFEMQITVETEGRPRRRGHHPRHHHRSHSSHHASSSSHRRHHDHEAEADADAACCDSCCMI